MFYYVNGILEYRDASTCVIDCNGVGYKLTVSKFTSESLANKMGEKTKLYTCNADRFRRIVDRVEARCVSPETIAGKVVNILGKRNPAFAYSINRNPLLLLLNVLPKRMQLWAIRMVLK